MRLPDFTRDRCSRCRGTGLHDGAGPGPCWTCRPETDPRPPATDLPGFAHELDLTAKPGTNGRVLRVRCRCMSISRKPRYHAYDVLAEVTGLDDAVAAWREHVAGAA